MISFPVSLRTVVTIVFMQCHKIEDLQSEFQQEREDYLFTIRQQERELKLKQCIIEHFIPLDEISKITKRAIWDEVQERWMIQFGNLAGNNVRMKRPQSSAGLARPVSEYTKFGASVSRSTRFRNENIVDLSLDMPERTTQDFGASHSERDVISPTYSSNSSGSGVYFSYGDESTGDKKKRRSSKSASNRRPRTSKRKPSSARNGEQRQFENTKPSATEFPTSSRTSKPQTHFA